MYRMASNTPAKKRQLTLDSFLLHGKLKKNESDFVKEENHKDGKDDWGKLMNRMQKPVKDNIQRKPVVKVKETASKHVATTKKCPFYKIVEGTSFVVDGFSYGDVEGITHYFLSHFHYDHYRGLKKNFQKPLYCSNITANLIRLKIKVDDIYIRELTLNETYVIKGIQVILVDANHCPGAVMFIFKLPTGKCILHVGDFRASKEMEDESLLKMTVDVLYLDTTYLSPEYDFPKQDTILMHCSRIARQHVADNEDTYFVIGSYSVGKEKVFKCVASALNSLIFADPSKAQMLRCLADSNISNKLVTDKNAARVHVVSMNLLQLQKLEEYRRSLNMCQVLVAFRPTGWEHRSSTQDDFVPRKSGNVYLYGLPYSEHSSYDELKRFVQFSKARKIIQTVFNKNIQETDKLLTTWIQEAKCL